MILSDLIDIWIKEKGWELTRTNFAHYSIPASVMWVRLWRNKSWSLTLTGNVVLISGPDWRSKTFDPTDPKFFMDMENFIIDIEKGLEC